MKKGYWLMALTLWAPAGSAAPGASLADLVEAHGGREALQAIEGYASRQDVTHVWVRESPAPGPPWRRSEGVRCHAMDLAGGRFAAYRRGTAPGSRPYHAADWLIPGEEQTPARGWQFNMHGGWRSPAEAGHIRAGFARAMRLAPTLLVRAMAGAPDRVTATGTAGAADASRTHFRFAPVTGPALRMAFDNRTRMLRELSVGATTVRFDGFEMVDGFPVSRRVELSRDGETVERIHVREAAFGPAFPDIPEVLRALPLFEPPGPGNRQGLRTRTLAPGLHLVGEGRRYQLFVEFRDFIVALGGLAGVEKRLDALRSVTGAKPLRYALITHHHARHLAGVPALVDAGAVLVTSPAHEAAVREAAGRGRTPRFAHVADRREITDGDRTLVFREIGPTRHSEHMLAAWLPAEKLLFTADLFTQTPGRTVPESGPSIRDLLRTLERPGLEATRFVDPHGPEVPNLAELKQAAAAIGNTSGFGEVAATVCPP